MYSQLRDFQYLGDDGIFRSVPEYPEFPWFEGIVNAIIHRLSEASDKRCYEKKNIMRSRTRKFFFFALFCPSNFS